MDASNALKEVLKGRWDSFWELAATSVGVEESVKKTLTGLSAEEINKGANGQACSPSLIRERVEALAAWNPMTLTILASEWVQPKDIDEFSWWQPAWSVSLRHLKALNAVQREDVDVPALSAEVGILWNDKEKEVFSWQEMKSKVQEGVLYGELRKLSDSTLRENTISVEDIADAPPEILRLLRGRYDLLDSRARNYIVELATSTPVGQGFPELIVEVCKELSLNVTNELCRNLARRIPTLKDPRKVVPLIYVLVSDWRVP